MRVHRISTVRLALTVMFQLKMKLRETGTFSSFGSNVCCLFFHFDFDVATLFSQNVGARHQRTPISFYYYILFSIKFYLAFSSFSRFFVFCLFSIWLTAAEHSIRLIQKLKRTIKHVRCCQLESYLLFGRTFPGAATQILEANFQT